MRRTPRKTAEACSKNAQIQEEGENAMTQPNEKDRERARGIALELNMCCSNPKAFAPECQCLDCVLRENTAQVAAQALAELRAEEARAEGEKRDSCQHCLSGNAPWWDEGWMHTVEGSNLDCEGNYPVPRTPSGHDFYDVMVDLRAEKSALEERVKLLERTCSKTNEEVCQSLGKVLGYPWFKDDQKNFPDATEENGVCVGEHVAESISEEAAKKIVALEERVRELEAEKSNLKDANKSSLH